MRAPTLRPFEGASSAACDALMMSRSDATRGDLAIVLTLIKRKRSATSCRAAQARLVTGLRRHHADPRRTRTRTRCALFHSHCTAPTSTIPRLFLPPRESDEPRVPQLQSSVPSSPPRKHIQPRGPPSRTHDRLTPSSFTAVVGRGSGEPFSPCQQSPYLLSSVAAALNLTCPLDSTAPLSVWPRLRRANRPRRYHIHASSQTRQPPRVQATGCQCVR